MTSFVSYDDDGTIELLEHQELAVEMLKRGRKKEMLQSSIDFFPIATERHQETRRQSV